MSQVERSVGLARLAAENSQTHVHNNYSHKYLPLCKSRIQQAKYMQPEIINLWLLQKSKVKIKRLISRKELSETYIICCPVADLMLQFCIQFLQ